MTYKSFSSLPRAEAVVRLGTVIENNLQVTDKALEYCGTRGLCYRLSSSIFPLITYDKAELSLDMLPNHTSIQERISSIKQTRERLNVRLSTHPDQFNVLASDNVEAVERTIIELNFQAAFMTSIGCPESYDSPINIHINRSVKNDDDRKIACDLFCERFARLSSEARNRLVLENDDKPAGWTVKQIRESFSHPITFDYLHHKCHPGTESEEEAFLTAHETWGNTIPLFHYSESAPGNNPRKHADYAASLPQTYKKTIDLDFEFKMKEKSIWRLEK